MTHVAVRPRTHVELCAGYGGLGLAIHAALPGVRLVGACERQAYATAVLASRMVEGALDSCPIWDDLESFPCDAYRGLVDIVTAGFPCQGASVAGKRRGVDDERWLWPEVWRITQALGARWLLVENVPGLLSVNGGAAFEGILRDLASGGWSCEWDCVSAGSVGAPHLRDRLFLLAADANRVELRQQSERNQRNQRNQRAAVGKSTKPGSRRQARDAADPDGLGRKKGSHRHVRTPAFVRVADGGTEQATADTNDPTEQPTQRSRCARQERPGHDTSGLGKAVADAPSERRHEGLALDTGAGRQGGTDAPRGDQPTCATGTVADADDSGLHTNGHGREMDGSIGETRGSDVDRRRGPRAGHADPTVADANDESASSEQGFEPGERTDIATRGSQILDRGRDHWRWDRAPQPTVRGVDDGTAIGMGGDPAYADELHLLGNGVVWQAAAIAFAHLWRRLHGTDVDV